MSQFKQFTSSKQSYGFIFWQTYMLWSRTIKKELRSFKLTHTQFVILSVIHHLEQSSSLITQVDVSSISKIDVMTVSASIKTLIKNKYVTSTINPIDSRANALRLTNEGKLVQEQAVKVIETIDTEFFNKDGIDVDAFIQSLMTLRDLNQDEK